MLKTIIAINLIFFYIIISFVVFYVKRSKIETIEIISISKQSKNRKIINNRKETIEQEMNYCFLISLSQINRIICNL